jgi:tripartite-type tricarboxylate transporter receptor subunit TctC
MKMHRRTLLGAAALALPARAQTGASWPTRPIRLLVPYPPGGASDITARLVAERLQAPLGQPVTVENRAGANGMIGTEVVARAAPDGHTLALVASSHVVNKALYPNITFDPLADFAPVVMTAETQIVMVVPASLPAATLAQFVAYARENAARMAYATSGSGSNPHLFAAAFLKQAGLELENVPYRGSAPAHADLLAGRTQMMFDAYAAVAGHVTAGRLRMLAQAGARRSRLLPDLPTVAEQGFPGYGATSWGGVLAPVGTPPPVIARLNAEINAILALDEIRARLAGLGAEVAGGTPQAFAEVMQRDQVRITALITELGIRGDS